MCLDDLRAEWVVAWGRTPHKDIGRTMLERSISFKRWEQEGGMLQSHEQKHLNKLVEAFKVNPESLNCISQPLKPGTRLIKSYKGKRHSVKVLSDGFEYDSEKWGSLSAIATYITGTSWNGWKFFA